MTITILTGCCLSLLATLPDQSVHTCVTSPPYWGLRNYGVPGQLGLEPTPEEYVENMVAVFREVRRVLRDDGTIWLNLGDSYAGSGRGGYVGGKSGLQGSTEGQDQSRLARGSQKTAGYHEAARRSGAVGRAWVPAPASLKQKDLVGIPWRVAFALQADGWYLRQRMPWVKRNAMPESARDRPCTAVEEMFLLSKSERYFYDYDAVKRDMRQSSLARLSQDIDAQAGSARANDGAKTNGAMKAVRGDKQRGHGRRHVGFNERWDTMPREEQRGVRAFRNCDLFYQSLEDPHGTIGNDSEIIAFDVATHSFKESHFATFPPKLIEPCILAGCPAGGTVLDPFFGAGTTGLVADRLGRHCTGLELNPEYVAIAKRRLTKDAGMFADVATSA